MKEWNEMEIAAYVDGELVGEDAQRIARIIETDPEAAQIALRVMELNDLLKEAFGAPAAEPAPAPMRATILGAPGKVAVLRRPFRPSPAVFSALAASAALAVGLGLGGALFGPAEEGERVALAAGPAPAAAGAAFATAASGEAMGGVRPLASFDTAEGPCREFEAVSPSGAVSALGLACRSGDGDWHVRVLAEVSLAEGAASGFAPASGAAADVVGALLDALGAGPALAPADEAARIGAGWR